MLQTSFQAFAKRTLQSKVTRWMIDLLLLPVALPLLITRYGFRIKFFRVHGSRFGHLAMHHETFLRKRQLGLIPEKGVKYIGICPTKVCNQQLLNRYKKHLKIVQFPQPQFVRTITKLMAENSILSRWDLFVVLAYDLAYFTRFSDAKPALSFTAAEEAAGKELLKKMGLTSSDWFICFHARDSAYVSSLLKRGDSRYTYRNSSIENFSKAVEYIGKQGGYALRMGAQVEKKLPAWNNHCIIDYATEHRTEFGDIYLPARCKFLIGTASGVESIASIFNTPTIRTNTVPLNPLIPHFALNHFPPGKEDLFIPKKIWSTAKNRFLTFKEEIEFDRTFSFDAEEYEKAGLVPRENTPEEILGVVQEMQQRLDGIWKTTKKDEELQQRFRALFIYQDRPYLFAARIGAQFLRENEHLLD